jgi:lysophospholipase L1-like esterase
MPKRFVYLLWLALALFPAAPVQAQYYLYFPLISRFLVPTITVTGGVFTYNAAGHAATATARGVGGVSVPGSLAYTYNPPGNGTLPVSAGTYTVTVQFTSSDPNYGNATGTGLITVKPMVFLAFGDSITLGYGDSFFPDAFPNCGYPRRVYERLGGGGNFAFYNSGVGGEGTWSGLSRFPDAISNPGADRLYPPYTVNTAPDLVIIMEGTNELYCDLYSLDGIEYNLRAMVSIAQQTGERVIIATIPPSFDPDPQNRQQCIPQFNPRIWQIGFDYGIPVADVYGRLYGHPEWMNDDGLHPNDIGYDQMADVFYQAVLDLMF